MEYVDFLLINGKHRKLKRKMAERLAQRGKGEIILPEPKFKPNASESVIEEAEKAGVDLQEVEGSGANGRILKRDVRNYLNRMMTSE